MRWSQARRLFSKLSDIGQGRSCMTCALFADGGCVSGNPSTIGGTWAYCHIAEDATYTKTDSGFVSVEAFGTWPKIENNAMELLAVVKGLQALPDHWSGLVVSDSLNTIGRVFGTYARNGIPLWLSDALDVEKQRIDLLSCRYVLVKGHPPKKIMRDVPIQVQPSITSYSPYPVSHFNIWCDDECKKQAALALQRINECSLQSAIAI